VLSEAKHLGRLLVVSAMRDHPGLFSRHGGIRMTIRNHEPRYVELIPREILMPLEILDRAFVFLRCCLAVERAEIFSFPRSRIFLPRIKPIFTGFQFPNHNDFPGRVINRQTDVIDIAQRGTIN
jgi:hypothetical protein